MNSSIETTQLKNIEVQGNGIIRNEKGYLIGRLVDGVDYDGEHVKGFCHTPVTKSPPPPAEEVEWIKKFERLAYPIVYSNTFPEKDDEYLEGLTNFISSLLSKAKQETVAKCLSVLEDEIRILPKACSRSGCDSCLEMNYRNKALVKAKLKIAEVK